MQNPFNAYPEGCSIKRKYGLLKVMNYQGFCVSHESHNGIFKKYIHSLRE